MDAYTPFQKPLKELRSEDLAVLRTVEEGWYVEYKRELPSAGAIAKSVSAFANTYGGWLFYGVTEKSKEEPVAGSFPGIERTNLDASLQRIRQAVAGHLNSAPHFEVHVIWGEKSAIDLALEHAVICIRIPWSPLAPHVHKSGHIYRRVADGSEPRPENDRYAIHQLFHRSDELRKEFREWVDRDPQFSKGEGKRPFLRLLMTADLWDERGPWLDATLEEMREIMRASEPMLTSVPFDSVHTSSKGFIARQTTHTDPHDLGLTWKLTKGLNSEVYIPLSFYTPDRLWSLLESLDGYDHGLRFVRELERRKYETVRVVDLNMLFNVLVGVVEIQNQVLHRAEWTEGFHLKTQLLNSWRTTPFVDIGSVIDGYEKHGIPMCLDATVNSPAGSDPETFAAIGTFEESDDPASRLILQSMCMFAPIALAYGIPTGIEDPDAGGPSFQDYRQAGQRAADIQARRAAE